LLPEIQKFCEIPSSGGYIVCNFSALPLKKLKGAAEL